MTSKKVSARHILFNRIWYQQSDASSKRLPDAEVEQRSVALGKETGPRHGRVDLPREVEAEDEEVPRDAQPSSRADGDLFVEIADAEAARVGRVARAEPHVARVGEKGERPVRREEV